MHKSKPMPTSLENIQRLLGEYILQTHAIAARIEEATDEAAQLVASIGQLRRVINIKITDMQTPDQKELPL